MRAYLAAYAVRQVSVPCLPLLALLGTLLHGGVEKKSVTAVTTLVV